MSSLTQQVAKHIREVYSGGNWTAVNLKDSLKDISWQQATTKVDNLNTIAALVFHINYYVSAVLKVFDGEPLNAHDKYAFDLPPINSEEDWQKLVRKTMDEADLLAAAVEKMSAEKLLGSFHPKYGTFYRNIAGIVEHTHYHLGQIVLIRKMLIQGK
jgi:hypothetical protein